MSKAVTSLAERLIRLQGDGDYAAVAKVLAAEGTMRPGLKADLDRLATKNIPVDIVYEQGKQVVGLN
jgi:alpha-D-ribose 1-methylphosphonate 5-triphosphate diphosphatase PhnM